jgi:hypothetical protein
MSEFFVRHSGLRATLTAFFVASIFLLLPIAGLAAIGSNTGYNFNHRHYCYDYAEPPAGIINLEAANAGERYTVFPLGIQCDFFMRDGTISTVTDYDWTSTLVCYGSLLFAAASGTGIIMLRRLPRTG